jgi:hypothetical protein
MKLVSACLLLLLYLELSGCGGSSMTMPGPPGPATSAFYEIAGTSNSGASFNFTLNGSLTFSGNNVTGVMHNLQLSVLLFQYRYSRHRLYGDE